MEKGLFLLALLGSVVYLFDRAFAVLRYVHAANRGAIAVATVAKSKKEVGSKQEPSLESVKKDDEQIKTLIDLLTAQNVEISKLSTALADTSARLTVLESSQKPRASRKAPVKASQNPVDLPSIPTDLSSHPAMAGFDGLPPVSGGFEPVH